ncbi:alkaline phosphatase family protein [Microbacterium maritypicum]|uniref:alkaline phosphatase family protein n=1 Tax=Microbacterium TaxID=33882 RepID=UPI0025FF5407|nr:MULTISPECIES: alkaline phosphatase family protein [Microbacterium]
MNPAPLLLRDLIPDLLREERAGALTLFLVDGLGELQLQRHAEHAPVLAHQGTSREVRSVEYPSSTPASVVSLLTSSPSTRHGVIGCEYPVGVDGPLFNPLLSTAESYGQGTLDATTIFERLRAEGVECRYLVPQEYTGSGFTQMTSAGALVQGYASEVQLLDHLETAFGFTYVYVPHIDRAGHLSGVGSVEWLSALALVDALLGEVTALSKRQGRELYVTSDHGMVSVAVDSPSRHDLRDSPELAQGVRSMGGDPRAPLLYCEAGAAGDVRARWTARFGADAVCGADEAVKRGWVAGPIDAVRDRIGDLVVALPPDTVVFDSRLMERPTSNRGFHGGLTPEEVLVPVIHLTRGER